MGEENRKNLFHCVKMSQSSKKSMLNVGDNAKKYSTFDECMSKLQKQCGSPEKRHHSGENDSKKHKSVKNGDGKAQKTLCPLWMLDFGQNQMVSTLKT